MFEASLEPLEVTYPILGMLGCIGFCSNNACASIRNDYNVITCFGKGQPYLDSAFGLLAHHEAVFGN